MYAIFETGGKQYRVSQGSVIWVEKLPGKPGDMVSFEQLLVVGRGSQIIVGTPYVKGAVVNATISQQGKAKKIMVFKYKAKSNYRKRYGHRQPFSKLTIDSIRVPD
ncbi:MAG TPA: 50S ribosomal protein L21 [Clostridiales bacterium UBA8153]|nr:50S ribosomal protein L21 [Clostridiales bacterium UBA8153]